MAPSLVRGADRGGADWPKALFPELHPDGRACRCHLNHPWRTERLCPDEMELSRRQDHLWPLAVFLLHPVPDRADPDGHGFGQAGSGRLHPRPCLGACGLRHRVFDPLFPQLLCLFPDRAGPRCHDRRRRLLPHLLAHHAASFRPNHRRHCDLAIHQYLERLPLRCLFRGAKPADDRGVEQPCAVVNGGQGIQRPFCGRDPCRPADPDRLYRRRPLFRARSDGGVGQGTKWLPGGWSRPTACSTQRSTLGKAAGQTR